MAKGLLAGVACCLRRRDDGFALKASLLRRLPSFLRCLASLIRLPIRKGDANSAPGVLFAYWHSAEGTPDTMKGDAKVPARMP